MKRRTKRRRILINEKKKPHRILSGVHSERVQVLLPNMRHEVVNKHNNYSAKSFTHVHFYFSFHHSLFIFILFAVVL